MQIKALLLATTVLALTGFLPVDRADSAPLSGQVSSAEEGAMEGVLVSAKKEGSTITTTVVTNDKGQFSFPAGRLEPGKYSRHHPRRRLRARRPEDASMSTAARSHAPISSSPRPKNHRRSFPTPNG